MKPDTIEMIFWTLVLLAAVTGLVGQIIWG